MVTKTDTTQIITQPKLDESVEPSLKRWLKHFFYVSSAHRYFSKQDRLEIAKVVQQAENGHVGEIQVVIEGHMPAREAYYLDTRGRAKQLFAELGVWDTELNSGILLYLNLCERKVEIVIDRGIQQATTQLVWDEVCQSIIAKMAQQQYRQALLDGVIQIGVILDRFYANKIQDQNDELENAPIMLN